MQIDSEMLAVAAYASGKCAAACAGRVVFVEITFYGPVVGQLKTPPRRVVIRSFGGRLVVAEGEEPAVVKIALVSIPGL